VLPWGDLFEDWLDTLGVGLDELCEQFVGSWMFGWADALRRNDVDCTIVAVTRRVAAPLRRVHEPTGAALWFLPPTRVERLLATHAARECLDGRRDPGSLGRAALAQVAPYAATPPAALRQVLRRERCDAIVCQEYETPRFDMCVALGALLRLPVHATFQGGDYQSLRSERLVRPLTMRRATGFVIAPSAEAHRVGDRYGVEPSRIARIFNPVDTDVWRADDRQAARAELGLPADGRVVAWHGQLHPRKGLDLLLDAWRRVRSETRDDRLRLVLVGSGEAAVKELVTKAADEQVQLLDEWVVDPVRLRRVLSAADVYAFPSRHEGFPVAPLEAMACALPVIAADAQGVRDIFERGEDDGGVVVPRDDVTAIAAALRSLLDDDERRRRVGAAARKRIEDAFAPGRVGYELRDWLVGSR
jgi:glycosyltransferase involved in cell wall biosynthesis